jgi:mRNA interferase RelE/StbE
MTEDLPYTLVLTEDSEADLKRLDKSVARRIIKKLRRLAANTKVYPHVALKGQWSGFYRLRVGDYRVIYALDHEERIITVIVIGHRSNIYDE